MNRSEWSRIDRFLRYAFTLCVVGVVLAITSFVLLVGSIIYRVLH